MFLHLFTLSKFKKIYKEVVVLLPKQHYKRVNARLLLKKQIRDSKIGNQLATITGIIKKQGYITPVQVQKALNLHESSARRRIHRLIKNKIIVKKSRGRYG